MAKSVSVIVPTRVGKEHFETENFSSLIKEIDTYGRDVTELVIIDDNSGTDLGPLVKRQYSHAKIIRNEAGLGFGASVNKGVKSAEGKLVLILNDDMKLSSGFIEPLTKWFEISDKTFAVTSKSMVNSKGMKNESISMASIDDGLFKVLQAGLDDNPDKFDQPATIFHAHGGASMFNREKFLILGGFDELYHPFYWEDVDLSFRAWRKGWKIIYEPGATLLHSSHSTIGKLHSSGKQDLIYYRNMHLFIMKNLRQEEFFSTYQDRLNALLVETDLFDKGVIRRSFYLALNHMKEMARASKPGDEDEKSLSLDEIIELSSLKPT